ncbi:hypothetical protein [Sphaerisporangium fuscum]|uniref:hypothetical protein n=1 Tax=Sphaerisporangium fuscum TaxID=2835868 RepID=UPI001BDC1401|nr:hypothetical protein [Sphaerisporangium fuscum]
MSTVRSELKVAAVAAAAAACLLTGSTQASADSAHAHQGPAVAHSYTLKGGDAGVRQATATFEAAASACQVRLYRPEVRPRQIAATVWAPGCKQWIRVELQRKRWNGWETLKKIEFYGAGPKTLYKGCKKGSTFTYRLIGGTFAAGSTAGPSRRGTC